MAGVPQHVRDITSITPNIHRRPGRLEITMTTSTEERILSELSELISEVTAIPTEEIELDKLLNDDLDVDSLSLVEIMVAAEERFGTSLPEEEMVEFKTVRDVVTFIGARAS